MISQQLKKLRENNGYTQEQVANALSISRSTYSYYEIGKTNPDINTIIKLAKIFNVSYTEILDIENKSCKPLNDSYDDFYSCYNFKKFNRIYDLSKKEKALISLYRVLPIDVQDDILEKLKKEVNKNKEVLNRKVI